MLGIETRGSYYCDRFSRTPYMVGMVVASELQLCLGLRYRGLSADVAASDDYEMLVRSMPDCPVDLIGRSLLIHMFGNVLRLRQSSGGGSPLRGRLVEGYRFVSLE